MDLQEEIIRLNSEGVYELLHGGANANAQGGKYGSPIQAAAYLGRDPMLEKLLDHQADINCNNVGLQNPHRRTPLSLAAGAGCSGTVSLLLARDGINVDSNDDEGRTALSWAAGSGSSLVVLEKILKVPSINLESEDKNGRTPLSWAAGEGKTGAVELLLKKPNVSPNSRDHNGRTPLSWAAGNGQDVVKLLVGREDVSLNSQDNGGRTPLSWAAEGERSLVTLETLLGIEGIKPDSGDKNGRTPLSFAAGAGRSKVVEILLRRSDVNPNTNDNSGMSPLWWAAKHGHDKVVKLFLAKENINTNHKDTDGRTLLSRAAEDGRNGLVKLLIAKEGVSPDSKDKSGRTALSWAAGTGRGAVVELLLQRPDVYINSEDNNNRTPLSWAAGNGHSTVVEILLTMEGIDVNAKDKSGQTPLLWALCENQNEVVRLLINRDTATLYSLVQKGNKILIESLLSSGYDVNRCGRTGMTPIRLAFLRKDRDVIELLLKYGAETENIMADEWLDVYKRRRTDIIQLVEGLEREKRISFIEKERAGEIKTSESIRNFERRLLIFSNDICLPNRPLFGLTKKPRPNELLIYYEDVADHIARIHVSLWFPAEGDTSKQYFCMPDWGQCEISWTIVSPMGQHDRPWKSVDHMSTLPNSWIPHDGTSFFLQFIMHMEERWLRLCNSAEDHLKQYRLDQMRSEGKNPELMRRLAKDAQSLTELRLTLQNHANVAENFIVNYCELYDANRVPKDLQRQVHEFQAKVNHQINQLDQTVRDLLQFEFAWASINETRISTRLGYNVMLFTYISIFYLPLSFCAALWAIPNISDTETRNPFIATSIIVALVTFFISFNLENITGLVGKVYQLWRMKLVRDMQHDRHWKEKGEELATNAQNSRMPSEWWLLGYAIHQLIVKFRTLRKRKQDEGGNLKKEVDDRGFC